VEPLGPKLAEGRDSEIFEHGPGRVLRRARDGRSLVREAEIMRYVRDAGYPVPAVHDAGDGWLVMDRLDGPSLLDAAVRRPWRIGAYGRVLADLHRRLHELPAPAWLPRAGVPGDRLLHRDLHPLNVIVTTDGPVVIDWANCASGDPSYDVADAWVLFATAEVPGNRFERALAAVGRKVFLRAFLSGVDRAAARAAIPAAVAHRLGDRNMTEGEKARMRAMAEWAVRSAGPS
jgi:aminoglycoside phosphotransferase (APT) family kinase protein